MKKVILKDGTELTIREREEDDAAAWIDYVNKIGGESDFMTFGKNGCRNDLEREKQVIRDMRSQPNSVCLVGWIGNQLACSANLRAEQKERLAHNCEIGISVRKKYWHFGAASALLTELIDFARNRSSLKAVHLGVYENNKRAILLYEKFGFVTVGRFRNYFQVGGVYFDQILMDLYL